MVVRRGAVAQSGRHDGARVGRTVAGYHGARAAAEAAGTTARQLGSGIRARQSQRRLLLADSLTRLGSGSGKVRYPTYKLLKGRTNGAEGQARFVPVACIPGVAI